MVSKILLKLRKLKKRQTTLEHYGTENPFQSDEVKGKIKQSLLLTYGVEHPSYSAEIRARRIETTRRHFGVDYPSQSEEVQEKKKQTTLEHYGVENSFQAEEVRAKIQQTNLERYGSVNPMQSEIVKERVIKTMVERYGVRSVNQVEEVKRKKRETCMSNYGTEYPIQSPEIQEKIKQTNLERFGTEYASQSVEIRCKVRQTIREHYGVDHNFQAEEVKERIRQTNREKYGVDYPCPRPEYRVQHGNNSVPNQNFERLLQRYDIEYQREYPLENFSYDFRVGDTLIEINSTITHNVLWIPWGDHRSFISVEYHLTKSKVAERSNFHCIHIFDWDNLQEIISVFILNPDNIFNSRYVTQVSSEIIQCDRDKIFDILCLRQGYKLLKVIEPVCTWYNPNTGLIFSINNKEPDRIEALQAGYFPVFDCGKSVWKIVN